MEDFTKVFTVEVKGSKGWEVIWTGSDILSALDYFRSSVGASNDGFRLTSPTDDSIYS
jgi:hypothetical protein